MKPPTQMTIDMSCVVAKTDPNLKGVKIHVKSWTPSAPLGFFVIRQSRVRINADHNLESAVESVGILTADLRRIIDRDPSNEFGVYYAMLFAIWNGVKDLDPKLDPNTLTRRALSLARKFPAKDPWPSERFGKAENGEGTVIVRLLDEEGIWNWNDLGLGKSVKKPVR